MSFGLMNAPATLQGMVDAVLKELSFVRIYLDEVVIYCDNVETHLMHCQKVINRVASHELKI